MLSRYLIFLLLSLFFVGCATKEKVIIKEVVVKPKVVTKNKNEILNMFNNKYGFIKGDTDESLYKLMYRKYN